MNRALLIVDIQNDYFPGGAMELVGSEAAAARAAKLIDAFRGASVPVIHIQHIAAKPNATFFLPGTEGAEIEASVRPEEGEAHFVKHFPNSFRETRLLDHLREENIGELVIAGMMTHMCIDTTTRAAADLGFACTLAHDACATRDLSFSGTVVAADKVQAAFVAAIAGTFAKVVSTDELISAVK